jgi:hypothetical protein
MSRLTSSLSSTTRTFRNRWATAFVRSVQTDGCFRKRIMRRVSFALAWSPAR